jgi:type IV pilus assembly protein PilQ
MEMLVKKKVLAVAFVTCFATSVTAGTLVESYEQVNEDGTHSVYLNFDHKSSIPEFDIRDDKAGSMILLTLKDTDKEVDDVVTNVGRVVQEIHTSTMGDDTTVSLIVDEPRYYSLKQDDKSLVLVLKDPIASQAVVAKELKNNALVSLLDLNFKRDAQGNAKLSVSLSGDAKIREKRGNKKIRITLDKVKIPEDWIYSLNMEEFATDVKSVDIKQEKTGGVIDVYFNRDMQHELIQEDGSFVLSLVHIPERKEEKDGGYISEEKINFSFENADLRSVLYTFATFTDKNIVISDSIQGTISLNVSDVSAEEILDTILRIKGLDKRIESNILLIAPADELAQHERAMLENEKSLSALLPVKTEFIRINYADANEIASLINQKKENEGVSAQATDSLIRVDGRTNTVIITDTERKIAELRKVVQELDKPIAQVMIEAKIVITTTDLADKIGIRWSAERGFVDDNVGYGGNLGQVDNLFQGNDKSTVEPMIDMGLSDAATTMAFGYLTGDILIGLELSALQSEGMAEVISTPKVITSDKHQAIIEAGTEIPYQEASSSGATSTSFKKAALSLKVTPQITPNNNVILDIDIKQDSVGAIYNGIPSIDTQHIATQVLVKEGETLVLGGVYKEDDIEQLMKTPFFGDLPILGKLFRQSIKSSNQLEMLVFVTPHVIDSIE